jgi:hypothetical protein
MMKPTMYARNSIYKASGIYSGQGLYSASSKVAVEYGLVTDGGDNISHGAGNLKARQFEQRNF